MGNQSLLVCYVASTHWDREWHQSFQQFRYQLVEVMDEVIDLMEHDSSFACFQTDGQSILLEDYLEIRSERLDAIRVLVREGRLRVGPWYTMPDENIPCAESLIRNLEEGIRVAKEFGNVERVGFVCDIFGHVSQLPQIFQGFGINNAFVWRGTNEDTHGGVFKWEGADGTEVMAFCFGPGHGYGAYAHDVRRCYDTDEDYDLDKALPRLVDYVHKQNNRTGLDTVLLFDGVDHMNVEPNTHELLDRLQESHSNITVEHVGLSEFASVMLDQQDKITKSFRGELRAPGRLDDACFVIPGVLSSRVGQKLANHAVETSLLRWAEPFCALVRHISEQAYPHSYLRHAWRYLLQNHAHDSICGCSIDQVHRDMDYRFDQARLISEKLISQTLQTIACQVKIEDLKEEEFGIVLFNSTQEPIDGPVDMSLRFDSETKLRYMEFFHYESKLGFRLYDPEGNEVAYDYLKYEPERTSVHMRRNKTPQPQKCAVVHLCVSVRIPAFGYTTLVCKPEAKPTRHPAGRMVIGDNVIENEFLRVEVNANGVLKLYDKRSNQSYERLLVFEDQADIGDGWYHGMAVNDACFSSTSCSADVAITANGAYKASLRVTNRMQVPEEFEFGNLMRRSANTKTLLIHNDITLHAGKDYVEVHTRIDNCVRDHRVRVLFETGSESNDYLADSAFDVVQRPISLPEDNHTYKELALETRPQASWTAVFDGQRGLAIVAPGLSETSVRDLPQRPVALTLLRGFRRTVMTDGEEGGQCLGQQEFNYAIVPLNGPPSRTQLSVLAQTLSDGVRTIQVRSQEQKAATERSLPYSCCQLALKHGRLIVTSLRMRSDNEQLEVRLYNPQESEVEDTMTFLREVADAAVTDLEGKIIRPLSVEDQRHVRLTAGPKAILTVALRHTAAE